MKANGMMSKEFYLYKYFNLGGSFKRDRKTIKRLDVFKEILVRKEIFIPSLSMLNDPFELMVNEQHPVLMKKDIGVLSFTSNEGNILMWSHYSGSHTGAAIKFKVSKESIEKGVFKKVHYLQKFEELNFFEDRTLVKSSDWSYENEYRVIFGYNSKLESLSELGLTIEGVVLGSNCDEKTYKQIREICLVFNYKHGKIELDKDFTCKCDLKSDLNEFINKELLAIEWGDYEFDDTPGPTEEDERLWAEEKEKEYQKNLAQIKKSPPFKRLVQQRKKIKQKIENKYLR